MPLSLGVRQGDDVYVGDDRLEVREIMGPRLFKVFVEKTGAVVEVNEDTEIQVMPDVWLSASNRISPENQRAHQVRLVIDAPKSVSILRRDKYMELKGRVA